MKTVICAHCGKVLKKGDPSDVQWFTCETCRDDIKSDHPLREVVFEEIGVRLSKRRGSYDLYYCPFHNDVHEPSFWVSDYVCRCEAGCQINGKPYGDVYDFVAEYYHLSEFQQTAEKLAGSVAMLPPSRTYLEKHNPVLLTMEDVVRLHKNAQDAMVWFHMRGITPFTVDEKLLGMRPSYRHDYLFRASERKGQSISLTTKHYSIPNVAFGQVYYCKLRRDDAYSMEQVQMMDPKLREAIREDIYLCQEARGIHSVVTDFLLMETVFSRYPQMAGPANPKAIFNVERVVGHTEDRQPVYKKLPYVLIHEGEIKALAMEDCEGGEYGYPSISNKEDDRIVRAVQGCARVLYVADPGPAGEAVALRHQEWIPNLEILHAPEGYKAADDVVLSGQVHEWMATYGLEPIKLERQHG